jgi:hypothetical protein
LISCAHCAPLGAFVASLQSCGSIHLGNGIRRLDRERTKEEHLAMYDRDRLAFYPFVVVRIACRVCSRNGAYRLARLAAKFGPEIGLRDLKRGVSACGVNFAGP